MKKYIISLIFFIISFMPLLAISQIKIKLQGGSRLTKINFTPNLTNQTTERKALHTFGVMNTYLFNNSFGISSGVCFDYKKHYSVFLLNYSSNMEDDAKVIELNNEFKLFYVDIPLNFEIRKQIRDYSLFSQLGVYYSYILAQNGVVESENNIEFETNFSDYFTKHDIGYNISLGLEYKLFSLQLYYKHSFNNLMLDKNAYSAKSNEFGILLSYNLLSINLRKNEK